MSNENYEHWNDIAHLFEIRQARIVAVFGRDGGAIVEQLRCVKCREGRVYREGISKGGGAVQSLDYQFTFSSGEKLEPALTRTAQARIIITGHHSNGHWIELRGSGLIGYDAQGHIEGLLDPLPTIITETVDISLDDPARETHSEAQDRDGHPLPPQFLQATKVASGASARRQALRAAQAQAQAKAANQARIRAKRR